MTMSRHYVLAAGGTGGHMMPAHALAEELMLRGHRVALVTDDRGARIPGLFERVQVHVLPAGRLSGGPAGWMRGVRAIVTGRAMALRLYETFRPSAVIGFGGYPALPALLAARADKVPTLVHEQNAVLGRVN
nr:glycosyltransferase [Pseudomonadota bacterium]